MVSGKNLLIFSFFFRQNCNKPLRKNIFLVILHSRPSYLVRAPPQLTLSPLPTTCAVDNFQRLIFGNSQSPDKFTGNTKKFSHPTSSQESLKHKSTFTFTLRTIYPSMRSMAQPYPQTSKTSIYSHLSTKGFDLPPITTQSSMHCCSTRRNFSKLTVKNRS